MSSVKRVKEKEWCCRMDTTGTNKGNGMNKPREWWIEQLYGRFSDAEPQPKVGPVFHVIEKSAYDELKAAIQESKDCWDAAYGEGFPEAMNELRDSGANERLLDLLDRRLLYALAPLVDVLKRHEGS